MIQVTLVTLEEDGVHSTSSETISIQSETTTLSELLESAVALLSLHPPLSLYHNNSSSSFVLVKDGKLLLHPASSSSSWLMTVHDAGIRDGDLIVVTRYARWMNIANNNNNNTQQQPQELDFSNVLQESQPLQPMANTTTTNATATSTINNTGGLDFSQLLNAASTSSATTASTTTTASAAAAAAAAGGDKMQPSFVYYAGMNLQEAQQYNPHPEAFIRVLFDHEHLQKELNYYSPKLAQQLFVASTLSHSTATTTADREAQIPRATEIWRNEMIKVRYMKRSFVF
jgi:hypothetical protein